MVKYIFWTIVIYFLIRFIFNFVIPVFRATRQMSSQVKDFQNKMSSRSSKTFSSNADYHSEPKPEINCYKEGLY